MRGTITSHNEPSLNCSVEGCDQFRILGSVMCRRHTRNAQAKAYQSTKSTKTKKSLAPEQVIEARRMRSQFKSYAEIARHFDVSLPTLRRALRAPK